MTNEEHNEERLGKLVMMAKRGTPNEKKIAISLIKKLCRKYKLDFEEVMNDKKISEFTIDFKTEEEHRVLIQVVCRYAFLSNEDNVSSNMFRKKVFFKTTKEKYIEALTAWEVLRKSYSKERKRMKDVIFWAFLEKHNLYYQPTDEEWKKINRKKSKAKEEEDDEVRRAGSMLSRSLEDVEVQKRLTANENRS